MRNWLFGWALLLSGASAEVKLLPDAITLHGPESRHGVLAVRAESGHYAGESPIQRIWAENEGVAGIADGMIVPKGNGRTRVIAETEHGTASAEVTVVDFEKSQVWSFNNHVMPVLARNNCNMGACHGAIAGKGGFRLSLRGYDPAGDYYKITREMRGRRIELAAPAHSLLLTKPTAATPHKGGRRIEPDSRDYHVLADWISQGAAGPSEKEATLTKLQVLPQRSVLSVGATQRLLVRASYSDGRTEDVTNWAKFTSADETVASVDEHGSVHVIGSGEGAVAVWFSSQIVMARVTVPFGNSPDQAVYASAPRRNFIDDFVIAQLEELRLPPSRRTNDEEFVRRVHLDTIGVLPSAEEVRSFVAETAPDKRDRLIDRLLARKEFVDYWTYRFADVFLINGKMLRPEAVKAYYQWLRENIAANASWAEIAREVVTAAGDSNINGATNFYAVHQDPETMAENVSQSFLGLSINCARCHNHPLEKWTNDQYYAFANLFSRVRAKGWGGDTRSGDGLRTIFVESRGDLIQPRTGKPQAPAPLDGEIVDPASARDRREALAAWLTAKDNKLFSRAITNRVWAAYLGLGLVEPVDDLRSSNPASNEPLLEALSNYLVEHNFDLKALMRVILQSETYQRSSEVLAANRGDSRYFSRYYPRRLMAEVIHDAVCAVTKVPSKFEMIELSDGSKEKTTLYPEGTRAMELYDSAVSSYFLSAFGRNKREITCECERSNQPSMVQVLHLSNGTTLNDKLGQTGALIDGWLAGSKPNDQIIEEGYLAALSRMPTPRERDAFVSLLTGAEGPERRVVLEDFVWAMLTSREFLFQR
jgi:hypothetical protein